MTPVGSPVNASASVKKSSSSASSAKSTTAAKTTSSAKATTSSTPTAAQRAVAAAHPAYASVLNHTDAVSKAAKPVTNSVTPATGHTTSAQSLVHAVTRPAATTAPTHAAPAAKGLQVDGISGSALVHANATTAATTTKAKSSSAVTPSTGHTTPQQAFANAVTHPAAGAHPASSAGHIALGGGSPGGSGGGVGGGGGSSMLAGLRMPASSLNLGGVSVLPGSIGTGSARPGAGVSQMGLTNLGLGTRTVTPVGANPGGTRTVTPVGANPAGTRTVTPVGANPAGTRTVTPGAPNLGQFTQRTPPAAGGAIQNKATPGSVPQPRKAQDGSAAALVGSSSTAQQRAAEQGGAAMAPGSTHVAPAAHAPAATSNTQTPANTRKVPLVGNPARSPLAARRAQSATAQSQAAMRAAALKDPALAQRLATGARGTANDLQKAAADARSSGAANADALAKDAATAQTRALGAAARAEAASRRGAVNPATRAKFWQAGMPFRGDLSGLAGELGTTPQNVAKSLDGLAQNLMNNRTRVPYGQSLDHMTGITHPVPGSNASLAANVIGTTGHIGTAYDLRPQVPGGTSRAFKVFQNPKSGMTPARLAEVERTLGGHGADAEINALAHLSTQNATQNVPAFHAGHVFSPGNPTIGWMLDEKINPNTSSAARPGRSTEETNVALTDRLGNEDEINGIHTDVGGALIQRDPLTPARAQEIFTGPYSDRTKLNTVMRLGDLTAYGRMNAKEMAAAAGIPTDVTANYALDALANEGALQKNGGTEPALEMLLKMLAENGSR